MKTFLLPFFVLLAWPVPAQTPVAPASGDSVVRLQAFKVVGTRVHESDTDGPDPVDRYDTNYLEGTGAANVSDFLEEVPPSPTGNEQLVLIDGHPTYLDPTTLPLDMIEGIDVSTYGSMPEYGAYAHGRVINIRLKKNYQGVSLDLRDRLAQEGGANQRGMTLSGATKRGKFRALYTFTTQKTDLLSAAQRDYARMQDHTAVGGSDFRLLWGSPAVVQAVNGPLNGVVGAEGRPTSVALAPENQDGQALVPADFIPGQVIPPSTDPVAAGQRRFNTADYLALVAPSTFSTVNLSLAYAASDRLNLGLSGSYSINGSNRDTSPPVSPASAATLVPAAFNPFGQDVEVGLVHLGFGPIHQRSTGRSGQLGLSADGRVTDTWKWDARFGYNRNTSLQTIRDLDAAKLTAALSASDPAARFDPFGNDAHDAALYPSLAIQRSSESESSGTALDFSTRGTAMEGWGGPVTLLVRGDYGDQSSSRSARNQLNVPDATTRDHSDSKTLTSTLTVPWVGAPNARPGLRRVETELDASYAESSDTGPTRRAEMGLLWVPAKPLLLRATYAESSVAPVRYVADAQPLLTETLLDPRRTPDTVSDVRIVTRDFSASTRGQLDQETLGATFEPPSFQGLRLSLTYDAERQENLVTSFAPQDLVNNEAAFPDRVLRADPTAQDLALNQPGAIVAVDTTPGNAGNAETSGLSFSADYRLPEVPLGQFRFSATARYSLESQYDVQPGYAFVSSGVSPYSPPDWTLQGLASWHRAGWNASTHLLYTGAIAGGDLPGAGVAAQTEVSLDVGYRFKDAIVGDWGRGVHVALDVGNVFNAQPSWADTVLGYRGGSPLGRTFSLRVTVPLRGGSKAPREG